MLANPSENVWAFIIENKVVDVLEILSERFVAEFGEGQPVQMIRGDKDFIKFKEYLFSISIPEYTAKIYKLLTISNRHLNNLCLEALEETDNIDYDTMIKIFVQNNSKPKYLPSVITYTPPIYRKDDINKISLLRNYLSENYKKTSRTFEKKGVLSSKTSTYWACENGHKNEEGILHCENCHIDRYGYKKGEMNPEESILILEKKIKALVEYFQLK